MPKLKNYGKGRRVNLWVPERLLDRYYSIENHSKFLQTALESAFGIMTFAILKQRAPEQYYEAGKWEEVVDEFNEKFPLDPLTKQRMEHNERVERAQSGDSSQPNPELW